MRTRKGIISTLIAVILLFTMNITTFATWIPDYYSEAAFWPDGKHYTDEYGFQVELNDSYKASDWFTNYFAGAYEWKWIYKPQDPIRRWDFLRFVYNMQMNAYPDLQYKNFSYSFKDIYTDDKLYRQYTRMSNILIANNIYAGEPTEFLEKTQNSPYSRTANLYAPLTRSQLAAILVNANNAWWHLEPVREKKNFSDIANDSNKDAILKAYELGLMNGTSDTLFSPNDMLTNEQAVVLADKIANSVYSYEIFIETMNLSDTVKITESYTKYYDLSPKFATENVVYMPGPPRGSGIGYLPKEKYPTKDSLMYENKTLHLLSTPELYYSFNVSAFISNRICTNEISIFYEDTEYGVNFRTNMDGTVVSRFPGEAYIKISNKYGSDILHVITHSDQSEYTRKPIEEIR